MSRGAVLVAIGIGGLAGALLGVVMAGNLVQAASLFGVAVACLWIGWFARGAA